MATAWKELFAAAVQESDPEGLPLRIEQARVAIMERVDNLLDDPDRRLEHDEIIDALNRLARLDTASRDET
jgi:hypothetical protein